EMALSREELFWPARLIRALKPCAIYWAGFALVAGAMALYLAYNGALAPMVDHFLHHVSDYGDERSVPLPGLRLLGPAVLSLLVAAIAALVIIKKAPGFYELFLAALIVLGSAALLFPARGYYVKLSASASAAYLPIFLFLAVAVWIVSTLRTAFKAGEDMSRWWARSRVLTIVGLVALGSFLEVYPRADFYHIVRALPPVFLLLAVIVYKLIPTLETFLGRHISQPRRASLLTLAAPLVLLAATGVKDAWQPQFDSHLRFIERTPLSLGRANGILVRPKQANMIEALAGAIEEHSSPGDSLFSFDKRGTGFYFLTGRKNPTRFVWWIAVGLKEGDRAEIIEMIKNRKIRLILLQDRLSDRRVREAVTNNYDLVRSVADIGVYRKRES
ncbi:MAG TPA: hypothetical protein VNO14_08740, partial [Blastocatellia bacterium]|nr:hypothetical protein [Blastocatellia bacterium]